MPRFHCPLPLVAGAQFDLPAGAARHVQVLRLQPGDAITLFNGAAAHGQWQAQIVEMGRSHVQVRLVAHEALECEHRRPVHLLAGITANERMDWLVEKATELGAASLTPLLAERSVLKLKGERGEKKRDHWQAVAVAACEQCGRNQVPVIHPAVTLAQWLAAHPQPPHESRAVLSLAAGSRPLLQAVPAGAGSVVVLSGPEGGLSPQEEAAALAAGFAPITLGPRVLRAETAPLAALALLDQG
ncbi:16S rRNA (uracil(1498)-N(3))-methyltransferase [Comamonas denitrificans]|uniref:16S rRNA (uracil(1498)-N(3))-methyltransferase n=1 Tax=Comamonas denitrificans TaxID=117506 RepID=UPI00360C38DF